MNREPGKHADAAGCPRLTRWVRGLGLAVIAVFLAAPARSATLGALADFEETWEGQVLHWEKARFVDWNHEGTAMDYIVFGITHPAGYTNNAGTRYPLVVYLHGAGARGSNNNANLERETARFFARQAQTVPAYNCFVLSPQVPSEGKFVDVAWNHGTYVQDASTYTTPMHLTEGLVLYLTQPTNDTTLAANLGIASGDIDTNRVYIVGDSMGAFGAWDAVGRGRVRYAAAMAACGSGPSNRIARILDTPLWAIQGVSDGTVPNIFPHAGDPDGGGSLGMLGLIDPTFDQVNSTAAIRVDDFTMAADDPEPADALVYSPYPSGYNHPTVALYWTDSMVSDFSAWLFAQRHVAPLPRLEIQGDGAAIEVTWPQAGLILQYVAGLEDTWADVVPPAASPYYVPPGDDAGFYRLREASATGS